MTRVWTNSRRGGVRALLLAWSLALTAALVLLAPPTSAWAHTALVDTQPKRDSVVTEPVTAVTLRFTEVVSEPYTTVVVTGPDGRSLVAGQPRVVGDTITQPVGPLPEGQIRVAWRTVSLDGHPVAGEFTFTVSARAATTASSPASPAEASAPSDATPPGGVAAPSDVARPGDAAPPSTGPDRSLLWPLAAGSAAVLALVVGVLWRRRRAGTGASGTTTGSHPAR